MRYILIVFFFFCNILFSADTTHSIRLCPGMNEITVKIINECGHDVNRLRASFYAPEEFHISLDSTVFNSAKGSVVSIPLKINVSGKAKGSIYDVTLTLRDEQMNSWNYTLSFKVENNVPEKYSLEQNYPNPFNPITTIMYSVPFDNENIRIEIYDITGKRIKTLVNEIQQAGNYSVTWNGVNDRNVPVSSGVYIYQFKSGSFTDSKRMILLK